MKVLLVVLLFGIAFAQDFPPHQQDWFYDKHLECNLKTKFNQGAARKHKLGVDGYKKYAQCCLELAEAVDENGKVDADKLLDHMPAYYQEKWACQLDGMCKNVNEDFCSIMVWKLFSLRHLEEAGVISDPDNLVI